jgi:hypothetical protein
MVTTMSNGLATSSSEKLIAAASTIYLAENIYRYNFTSIACPIEYKSEMSDTKNEVTKEQ